MSIVPTTPLILTTREEWPDADFDFGEDEPIHTSDGETALDDDADDWDVEMDLGKTGGATVKLATVGMAATTTTTTFATTTPIHRISGSSQMFNIRPPISTTSTEEEDDEEGFSTIKADTLKPASSSQKPPTIDEDLECDFALPDGLTQLSLRPLSLHHRSSRSSFEWGDKDHTSSSQSSDNFSTFGFSNSPISSTSASASAPETEADEDSDELDGLVIPSGIFETGQGSKHLSKLLEMKRKLPVIDERTKVTSPDPEDDYEMGLVIDDDADFSPSRLRSSQSGAQRPAHRRSLTATHARSESAPTTRPSSAARPPSRGARRTRSPTTGPPPSSMRHFQTLSITTSAAIEAATRSAASSPRNSQPPSAFLAPKSSSSLRGQKSHNNIKPVSPPTRHVGRKASLSSLIDSSATASPVAGPSALPVQRYEAHTAASRAKLQHTPHANSTGRITALDYGSINARQPGAPAGLTMPASSSRLRSRPSISGIFPREVSGGSNRTVSGSSARTTSPVPPTHASRTSSSASASSAKPHTPPPFAGPTPKLMRKPKRAKAYGDGTELDGFDDLPTDGDQESRFRVQAKGHSMRTASGTAMPSSVKVTVRRESSSMKLDDRAVIDNGLAPSLRRAGRIEFAPSTKPSSSKPEVASTSLGAKKKKTPTGSPNQKRKPTLIRNLGGAGAPKVVGEMKWNPQSLRWEGNDQALREFDAATTSARPALITHLTGSSMGSPAGLANGARKVGNMVFDPSKMCWISTLAPEDDEPDVFADLADDEQDEGDSWARGGGTVRAGLPGSAAASDSASSRLESPSPARSVHSRASSETGSERGGSTSMYDRGSRASMCVPDVDEPFRHLCREAEARHNAEMAGWRPRSEEDRHQRSASQPNRTFLFEIRALATRQY